MPTNKTLEAALYYSEKLHFSVIPVGKDKKALIKWEEFQKRIATRGEIEEWYKKFPEANVGVVTGMISGIVVVDVDDPDQAKSVLNELIPDNLIFPISDTPSGGEHNWFRCTTPDLRNNAKIVPGADFRGEGGYVVAPPSVNGNGKQWSWRQDLKISKVALPVLPAAYITYINNNNSNIYKGKVDNIKNPPKSVDSFVDMFTRGRRDNDLFHVANLLIKGGAQESEALQVLKTIAHSWGEGDQGKWLSDKIKSALNRSERRDRTLAEEVREFVLSTNGYILSTEIHNSLQLSTREDKKNVSMILKRMSDQGLIQRTGKRHGQFRVIDSESEDIDFESADDSTLDVRWPFEIEQFVDTFPKSISIVAGAPNSGKTAFMLNLVRLNIQKHKINYFSSEMGKVELKARLKKFGIPLAEWKQASWKERATNFADVVKPDEINIIDFLELHTDFYLVGQMIKDIFDRLDKGIAVIALQKNAGMERGLGGFRSLEKARLYVAMDAGSIKIVKGKNWHNEKINPNGYQNYFKLVQGCKFIPETWISPEALAQVENDKKYGGFK